MRTWKLSEQILSNSQFFFLIFKLKYICVKFALVMFPWVLSSVFQFTINVSTDMRHHRVRLIFQDSPLQRKKRGDQSGIQVILDPVQSVKLMDWWHPQYPSSPYSWRRSRQHNQEVLLVPSTLKWSLTLVTFLFNSFVFAYTFWFLKGFRRVSG